MSQPTIYIMCGVPGSGKTYFAKHVLADNPFRSRVYISSDDIREEICGDAADQSKNSEVFAIFYERAYEAAQNGDDVILDATFLTAKARKKCRARFKNLNCRFIAVQMNTPMEKARRRNEERDRIVPEYVMDSMIERFEPVSKYEHFNGIWRI